MKLLAYKIEGKIINKEIFNWTISDLNGNKPWIVSQSELPNYADISSIENWDNLSNQIDKDYLFIRQRIKELVNDFTYIDKNGVERTNSERLNLSDSVIASKYFLIPKSLRDNFLSEVDQQFWWKILVEKSQQSRQIRWEAAKTWISYNLPPVDSSDLAKSTTQLCNDYINYNIISKSKDGISGLFDYLTGVEDYSNNGFPSKSYWQQYYQEKLMDILENGNY
jgi:hypothetical protein